MDEPVAILGDMNKNTAPDQVRRAQLEAGAKPQATLEASLHRMMLQVRVAPHQVRQTETAVVQFEDLTPSTCREPRPHLNVANEFAAFQRAKIHTLDFWNPEVWQEVPISPPAPTFHSENPYFGYEEDKDSILKIEPYQNLDTKFE